MARKLYPDGLYKTTVSIKKYDENGNELSGVNELLRENYIDK